MASTVNARIAAAQEPIFLEGKPAVLNSSDSGTGLHVTSSAETNQKELDADALRIKESLLDASSSFEDDNNEDGET